MRVLVTEDDEVLAAAVANPLRREGMAVDVALDGAACTLERLAVSRYDVVVLTGTCSACPARTTKPPSPLPRRRRSQ